MVNRLLAGRRYGRPAGVTALAAVAKPVSPREHAAGHGALFRQEAAVSAASEDAREKALLLRREAVPRVAALPGGGWRRRARRHAGAQPGLLFQPADDDANARARAGD